MLGTSILTQLILTQLYITIRYIEVMIGKNVFSHSAHDELLIMLFLISFGRNFLLKILFKNDYI